MGYNCDAVAQVLDAEREHWDHYRAFLRWEKPMCVVEQRKAPLLYKQLLNECKTGDTFDSAGPMFTMFHALPEGREAVLSRDARVISGYVRTLWDGEGWRADPSFQRRALGQAFGYSFDEINSFIAGVNAGSIDCDCSKCLGVHAAAAHLGGDN